MPERVLIFLQSRQQTAAGVNCCGVRSPGVYADSGETHHVEKVRQSSFEPFRIVNDDDVGSERDAGFTGNFDGTFYVLQN
jgi:hypothetical protein